MSGRKKTLVYRIFLIVCGLAAAVGTVVIACNGLEPSKTDSGYVWAFAFAIVSLVLLPLNTLVHECGHLVFGACVGMKFSSVRFGRLRLVKMGKKVHFRFLSSKDVAGSCEMYPKNQKNVGKKMVVYSLGGAIFNLIFGVAFTLTCILCAPHPALYFFQLFAPLSLIEAAAALFPVETATGRTDGEVVRALLKREGSATVAVHVLTAQGILNGNTYAEIGRGFLFELPVVREDDAVFLALTQLRWQYLFYLGEEKSALGELSRLEELYSYLPEINQADVACDLIFAHSALEGNEARAEEYLADAALCNGSCAYYRAMAAYFTLRGEREEAENYLSRAYAALQEEPMKGIFSLEERFLQKIKTALR